MSDRTRLHLRILDCPLDQVRAVLDVIEKHRLHMEYDDEDHPAPDQLGLGLSYMDNEVVCGSAEQIATQLQQSAPGASWEVWEAPMFDWLGDLYRFTPELGLWTAECSSEGDALFTTEQVIKLAGDQSLSGDELATKLGITHEAALRDRTRRNEGIVLTLRTEQEPDMASQTLVLCECCALKLAGDDESGCRDYHHHTHEPLDVPACTAISRGPCTHAGTTALTCDGHTGGVVDSGQTYWVAEATGPPVAGGHDNPSPREEAHP